MPISVGNPAIMISKWFAVPGFTSVMRTLYGENTSLMQSTTCCHAVSPYGNAVSVPLDTEIGHVLLIELDVPAWVTTQPLGQRLR